MVKKKPWNKGYILLEILMGLFLFGLGFTVILGLIQTVALANGQAHNLLEAVNLAGSTTEEITYHIKQDRLNTYSYLSGELCDQAGMFRRTIRTKWDSPDVIWISVEIQWTELGEHRNYSLESLLMVE
ncbi:MAG: hypothetical protein GX434_06480 [Peptococcaceae bacterium]|nr:hypothetical protein [Peptococcaceae bacterium]